MLQDQLHTALAAEFIHIQAVSGFQARCTGRPIGVGSMKGNRIQHSPGMRRSQAQFQVVLTYNSSL
jgi:hypothetical protein